MLFNPNRVSKKANIMELQSSNFAFQFCKFISTYHYQPHLSMSNLIV